MKKIPTLYVRDRSTHLVTEEVTPGCEWVFTEPNVRATRKWDGTCCLVRNKTLYKRQEIKPGKPIPPDFEEADYDENTGKRFGWVPVGDGPDDRWHREAHSDGLLWDEVTYELCGPKVQGNPEKFTRHVLIPHGQGAVDLPGKPYHDALKAFFSINDIEGIVFTDLNRKRFAKIKAKDFGMKRGQVCAP